MKQKWQKKPEREALKDTKSCFEKDKPEPKEEGSSEGNRETPLEVGPSKKDPSEFFGGGQRQEGGSNSQGNLCLQGKEWLIKKPQDKLQKKSEACCEESEEKSHNGLLKRS
jgi:hypothetical protein